MTTRQREDRTVALLCYGISGIALVLGIWIAAPAPAGSALPVPVQLAEGR